MSHRLQRSIIPAGALRRIKEEERDRVADVLGISPDTFRWKYLDHPTDSAPIIHVVERGGRIRGAIGWFRLTYDLPDRSVTAVVLGDLTLPENDASLRRKLPERSLQRLADDGVEVAIDASLPHETARVPTDSWQTADRLGTLVQPRRPSRLAAPASIVDPIAAGTIDAMVRIRKALDGWRRALTSIPVDVERREGVPETAVRMLSERGATDHGGVRRSRRFWRWRVGDPRAAFRTFTLFRRGVPVAVALLANPVASAHAPATIVAIGGPAADERACVAVLVTALTDCADADLVFVPENPMSSGVLERLGILSSTEWPLSLIAPTRRLQFRPLGHAHPELGRLLCEQVGMAECSL